jgi:hypothetical protein
MEPTPYEIDIAMAKAWAASTPGLQLRWLTEHQGWVLEADEAPARLHLMAGIVNPSPEVLPELCRELKSLAQQNPCYKIFSLPDCARMRKEDLSAAPFQRTPPYADRHYLLCDAERAFSHPGEAAFHPGEAACDPLVLRKAVDPERLEILIKKMAQQFYPEEPAASLALQVLSGMSQAENTDFLEFSLRKTDEIVGGMVVLYHQDLCFHVYGFFAAGYRGKGFVYRLPGLFQRTGLRAGTRHIIGETLHISLRPGLRLLYEKLGAQLKYSRCYYAIDFF